MTAVVIAGFAIQFVWVKDEELPIRLDARAFEFRIGLACEEECHQRALRPIQQTGGKSVMLCEGDPAPLVERVLKPCGSSFLAEAREHRALASTVPIDPIGRRFEPPSVVSVAAEPDFTPIGGNGSEDIHKVRHGRDAVGSARRFTRGFRHHTTLSRGRRAPAQNRLVSDHGYEILPIRGGNYGDHVVHG